MDVTAPNSVSSLEAAPAAGRHRRLHAGGHVHFSQRIRHAAAASLSAADLQRIGDCSLVDGKLHHPGDGLDRAFHWAAGGIRRPQEGYRPIALRSDRSDPVGGDFAKPAPTRLLAIHARSVRAGSDRRHHGIHQRGVPAAARGPGHVGIHFRDGAGRLSGTVHLRSRIPSSFAGETPSSPSGS